MKHSIIIKVGENLIYQCAPELPPTAVTSSSPVEFNRALPEWEHTAKACIIKKSEQSGFDKYIEDGGLVTGVNVPYDVVEIYSENGKKYARYSENPQNEVAKTEAPAPQIKAQPQAPPAPKYNEKGEVYVEFVLNIDSDGNPALTLKEFRNATKVEEMLIKSFLKQGSNNAGVVLNELADGGYELLLDKK